MENLYITSNNTFRLESLQPTCLKIFDAITIHRDGRVEIDPKYTTDEAAKMFWDAVQKISPNFLQKETSTNADKE